MSDWTNVDEQLPDIGQEVLLYIPEPHHTRSVYAMAVYGATITYDDTVIVGSLIESNGDTCTWAQVQTSEHFFDRVTHWQPRPTSPK